MKIIGIDHQIGNYEGRDYDNYNLYCVQAASKSGQYGLLPVRFQRNGKSRLYCGVKAAYLHTLVAPDHIIDLIGKEVVFYFDNYGNVASMEISK